MANFEQAHQVVMGHEGAYANNPSDKGGETYKGIARKLHPGWAGWSSVDAAKKLTSSVSVINQFLESNSALQKHVLNFYKMEFWDRLNLDQLQDQQIANELYDTGVNMGTGTAATFLQKALNVLNRNRQDYADLPITATIGPLTTKTVNQQKRPDELLKVLNCLQGARYIDICLRDPGQEKFMRSWLSRVVI